MQRPYSNSEEIFVERKIVPENFSMPFYHIHDSFEIFYLQRGHVHYFIEDKVFELNAGSMIIISPFLFHKTVFDHNKHERILVDIPTKLIDEILKYLDIDDVTKLLGRKEAICLENNHSDNLYLDKIYQSLVKEFAEKNAYYKKREILLLEDIIIYILRRGKENTHACLVGYKQPQPPIVSSITDYLSSHLDESITLDALSEMFHLERTYLCHIFKKTIGLTIWEYLHMNRVREACKLLLYSTEPIIDIANADGFSNIAHFGRVFQKLVGRSPRQYRSQAVRNDNPSH
jgi:AraC-like DNA-binding protein